jgi:hypothetical protein
MKGLNLAKLNLMVKVMGYYWAILNSMGLMMEILKVKLKVKLNC